MAARAGEFGAARMAFTRMLALDSLDVAAKVGLGGASEQLGDTATATRMRRQLAPTLGDPRTRDALHGMLADNPRLWPRLLEDLRR
jgi:hypothetical protein